MTKFKVLVCGNLAEDGLAVFRSADNIELDVKPELKEAELIECIAPYHGLVVRSDTKPTAKVIEAADNLKIIGRAGTGVDNIDAAAATKRGIVVMNTPGGNTVTTCEHAFALMMALARNVPQGTSSLKSGRWERKKLTGVELYDKTLGIIGMGRIGGNVATRAIAFGMHPIAFDPYLTKEAAAKLGVESVSLADLFARSDFITLHTPFTPETANLINEAAFAKMKPGVRIVNCARGGLIDEDALVEAIKSGKVAGAALDVFATEPPATDHPLFGLDKVIYTPHLGASTTEAQVNVAVAIAHQMVDFFKTGAVFGAVNVPAVSAEVLAEVGPSITLGEKLGSFQGQAFGHNIKRIHIEYNGRIAESDVRPVTQAILVGLMRPTSDCINFVNASLIAEERGIKVTEAKNRKSADYASLISIWVETDDRESEVAGALFGEKDLRIVRVNGFALEAIPKGNLLLCTNRDVPGVLGRICTKLGENQINIAQLYLGRKELGGSAILLAEIDSPASSEILTILTEIPDVLSARSIQL
ncbi:MAG: phosphoglycerate dehydrogenase [Blastocatellia bacterium]|nr:phosphoglycerate dehydrogenase [Blastocatellia bacterium]